LTADLQILGQRHKDLRNGLSAPPRFTPKHLWQMASRPFWCLDMLQTRRRTFGNIIGHAKNVSNITSLAAWTHEQFDPRLSWADVAWIKEQWGGPLIIKGVLDPEDARAAADTGADIRRDVAVGAEIDIGIGQQRVGRQRRAVARGAIHQREAALPDRRAAEVGLREIVEGQIGAEVAVDLVTDTAADRPCVV
ncbi:alpha-hydroxy-acid oxidizing protein, partial [Rhizobium phaseoli]